MEDRKIMEGKFQGLKDEWLIEIVGVESLFFDDNGLEDHMGETMPDEKECRQLAATLLLVQAVRDVRDAINNLES